MRFNIDYVKIESILNLKGQSMFQKYIKVIDKKKSNDDKIKQYNNDRELLIKKRNSQPLLLLFTLSFSLLFLFQPTISLAADLFGIFDGYSYSNSLNPRGLIEMASSFEHKGNFYNFIYSIPFIVYSFLFSRLCFLAFDNLNECKEKWYELSKKAIDQNGALFFPPFISAFVYFLLFIQIKVSAHALYNVFFITNTIAFIIFLYCLCKDKRPSLDQKTRELLIKNDKLLTDEQDNLLNSIIKDKMEMKNVLNFRFSKDSSEYEKNISKNIISVFKERKEEAEEKAEIDKKIEEAFNKEIDLVNE